MTVRNLCNMKCSRLISALVFLAVFAAAVSCSTSSKLSRIRKSDLRIGLALPSEEDLETYAGIVPERGDRRDTLVIKDLEGREVYIMSAVQDEITGEMVATEQLAAAVVTARFRNVAERNGKVNLEFQISVPSDLQDSRWQLRFHPRLYFLEDSLKLDDVVITGSAFREGQLRGYEQYHRFMRRMVTDSLRLTDVRSLEIFLKRNFPQVYAFKNDTSYVSDSQFESAFGLTSDEALEHYRRQYLIRRNRRIGSMADRKWRQYVRNPIETVGIRLDTVIRENGDFVYNYTQTIPANSRLKKVVLHLDGDIRDSERRIYHIPESEPLSFYISSVSTLLDEKERYLTMVVYRNLDLSRSGKIEFRSGSAEIDESLEQNRLELDRVKATLRELAETEEYEIDSIIVAANASPEGKFSSNRRLSQQRSESAASYMRTYMDRLRDSLMLERGILIELDEDMKERTAVLSQIREVEFLPRHGGENWEMLEELVSVDTLLGTSAKNDFFKILQYEDPDRREEALRRQESYKYIRKNLYPQLRTVDFRFYYHRSGMLKDTVHTNVLDSVYMRGVTALKDRDYPLALELLQQYGDLNSALAMISMERNNSALEVLLTLPEDARTHYLLALVYSRLEDEQSAVEHYLKSCSLDRSYVNRGNLDPEISGLIAKYSLDSRFQ